MANPSTTTLHDAYGENILGIYVSDVINRTDRFSTMLSLPYKHFEQTYDGGFVQPSLSPKLGIAYQIVKDQVSLFGNFMNGFQNKRPVEQPNGSLFKPKPVSSNQLEAGVKAELPGNRLGGSISYYHIRVDNALRTRNARYSFQNGQQLSKSLRYNLRL